MTIAPDLITRLSGIAREFDGAADPSEVRAAAQMVADTARDAVSEILRLRELEAKLRPPLPGLGEFAR